MSRNTKINVGNIIAYLLLLLFLALIIAFLAKFTNGFTSDFKTFYVVCNSETILNDKTNQPIYMSDEYRFDVKYTFGFFQEDSEKLGYHVKIVPNATEETDFEFSDLSGKKYLFSEVEDLSKGFEITENKDYFTLKTDKDLSEILSLYFLDTPLSGIPSDTNKDYFLLVVSSEDYSTEIKIAFNLCYHVSEVKLFPENLVF